MSQNLITETLEKSPWIGLSKLVELTALDKDFLKEALKAYLESGAVVKAGKARGTKYACAGAEAPQESSEDFSESIRSFMKETAGKITRKMLVNHLGTYEAKFMPCFKKMIESGEVRHNQKKRGQVFWLAEHEESGVVVPDPTPAQKMAAVVSEEPEEKKELPPITDIKELVSLGLRAAIDRSRRKNHRYQITELSEYIAEHRSSSFTTLHVSEYIVKNWRTIDELSVVCSRDNGHYYYYIPTVTGVPIALASGETLIPKTEEAV
jgi:hypothetical protein